MTIWLDGRLVASGTIDPSDRGFTLGDGLFETIRIRSGVAASLSRHLARLRDGAAQLDIPLTLSDETLAEAAARLVETEDLREGHLRLTLTRGPAPRGILPPANPKPTLLLTAGPLPPATPVRLAVARTTRRNEHSPLARIKSLNTLDNVLARLEAARRGADDALLLNSAGRVAESSVANLFALIDGVMVTPPVVDGALPGIMRGLLIERMGAVERSLTPEDLNQAEAMLLSNSLGLRPVTKCEGTIFADGSADLVRRAIEMLG